MTPDIEERDALVARLRREYVNSGLANDTADLLTDQCATISRLNNALTKQNEEICQTLGKALGYPWFKDDQINFPGAGEESGVCVGDHVAESLATEAAKTISHLTAEVGRLRADWTSMADWLATERAKLGAIDGYDYHSGVEFGLREAEIEITRRARSALANTAEEGRS